jgi:Mn-dependent DtxR family transcriptional regulator
MENLDKAVNWLQHLNHKKYPQHPEETLQRTIQNLRDKGYIIFHGQGEYELTDSGIEECKRVAYELNVQVADIDETIQMVKEEYNTETIEKAREIIGKLSPEEIENVLKKLKSQL